MQKFEKLTGLVVPLDRANVDTDAIIPKQFLKSIKRSGFGPYAFDEWRYLDHGEPGMDCNQRPLNPDFVLNQARYQGAQILLARENFGCGSSREQAVTCLRAAGVRALIAASFARIFYRNAIDNGVLPITCPEAAAAIRPGETISVDLDRCVVQCAAGEFPFQPLSPSVQQIFEAGGLLEMLRVIPNTKYPLPKASSTEVICEQSV